MSLSSHVGGLIIVILQREVQPCSVLLKLQPGGYFKSMEEQLSPMLRIWTELPILNVRVTYCSFKYPIFVFVCVNIISPLQKTGEALILILRNPHLLPGELQQKTPAASAGTPLNSYHCLKLGGPAMQHSLAI